MYLFLPIFMLFLLFFYCIGYCRKKKCIKKVCCMRADDKCKILNNLIEPFGYAYVPSEDIFTSRIDAWQRQFGYGALYDKAASHFGMIINSLPVYFNYDNRTWLIEFWKGQYGINTGCEIGVYYADRIINENELEHTIFKSVSNEDMPELYFTFYNSTKSNYIAQRSGRHWWLTAFKPGLFSIPSNLSLFSSITLKSPEMAYSFARALIEAGCLESNIKIQRNTVTFTFEGAAPIHGTLHKLRIAVTQFFNWLWCRLYMIITRPFTLSMDRVLYMYYYLPFIFRRMLNIRKNKGYKN